MKSNNESVPEHAAPILAIKEPTPNVGPPPALIASQLDSML